MITKHSIETLNNLNLRVMHRYEDLLAQLNVDYHANNTYLTSTCPIHGGDNETALNIYLDGCRGYPGNWRCNTQNCHEHFIPNIIGFTKGVLSHQKLGWSSSGDKTISDDHTIQYLLSFLGTDYVSLQTRGQNSKQIFTNQINGIFARNIEQKTYKITREEIRQKLQIPAQYYIDRGYSAEILNLYDIGLCSNPDQPMYGRVVVPIYDKDGQYIGCTGRSTKDNPKRKWFHSEGLHTSEHLFNYHRAKEYIKKSQVMIIVEGIGDVLRLEEAGIRNSVAIFGISIGRGQETLIHSSGALSLIILLDQDKAGLNGMRKIQSKFGQLYRLYFPSISGKDVGELNLDVITNDIKPYIKQLEEIL